MSPVEQAEARGHGPMTRVTDSEDRSWVVWNCDRCGLRVVRYGPNVYGSCLENDCSEVFAA